MNEFSFIREYLASVAGDGSEQLKDDCAWVKLAKDWLVVSTDTSIEGVHFPKTVKGAALTERAVRIAASDIACKGADPIGMLVAMTLPHNLDPRLPRGYVLGLDEVSNALCMPLLGGDTTRHDGPLSLTVTVLGATSRKLLRSGAKDGDGLFLSGPIGDAALGLRYMSGKPADGDGQAFAVWEEAFLRPDIDFALGKRIASVATATIDVSDGLLADAEHIADASNVRLVVEAESVPFSKSTAPYAASSREALLELVTAGDDYRILFTAPPDCALGHRIGHVEAGQGVRLCSGGEDITPDRLGYEH